MTLQTIGRSETRGAQGGGEVGYIRMAAGNPCGILTWPFSTTVI
jgi:hypothetical protein